MTRAALAAFGRALAVTLAPPRPILGHGVTAARCCTGDCNHGRACRNRKRTQIDADAMEAPPRPVADLDRLRRAAEARRGPVAEAGAAQSILDRYPADSAERIARTILERLKRAASPDDLRKGGGM
jgi:hypothetical protein